jgi:hypothetical protein
MAIAVVLLGLGFACLRAGRLERRVADAHEQLAILQYDALDAAHDEIEQSMGVARRIPWLTGRLMTGIREQRAAAEYWQARYERLEPERDASGMPIGQEPAMLALTANATYRASQQDRDRQATLRQLDTALKRYSDLLKKSGGDADAAYNYEFVVRLRDTISRSRPALPSKRDDPARAGSGLSRMVMAGDLPEGRTLHGEPGSPPPQTDMSQFKMHIPVRPDERQGGSDAGQGKQKIRKG